MEIKQSSMKENAERAAKDLEDSGKRARIAIGEAAERAAAEIQQATEGIAELNEGAGALLDRCAAVFVQTWKAPNGDGEVCIGGARLEFPVYRFIIDLDNRSYHDFSEGPTLKPGQRYRVFVMIEAMDEGEVAK